MKYNIISNTEKTTVQEYGEYVSSVYLTPSVNTMTAITYSVNDIKLETSYLSNTRRLQLYGKKVRDWRRDNNVDSISAQVVIDAVNDTESRAIGAEMDGEYCTSDNMLICACVRSNQFAWESFNMINLKYANVVFVKELDKQRGVDIREYDNAYLYRHTSQTLVSSSSSNRDEDDVVKENMAYRLLETFHDKEDERSVSTVPGVLDYMEYLGHGLGYDTISFSNIIKEVTLSHKLWDSLTVAEIIEIVQVLDEDEIEEMTTENVAKLCNKAI